MRCTYPRGLALCVAACWRCMLCGHILLIEVIAMRELRFTLANVPGTLAEVTTVLGKGNVNIDGIVGVPGGSLVCLVVDDTGRARGVLQRLGLTFQEREAVALDLPDRPGELGKLLERLPLGGSIWIRSTRPSQPIGSSSRETASQTLSEQSCVAPGIQGRPASKRSHWASRLPTAGSRIVRRYAPSAVLGISKGRTDNAQISEGGSTGGSE